ncbi:MAG: hypothetical protein KR126chlam1_00832 [Chlamydiae bacterium]|nr:hypothetical protein [Chlamydiota bacterium]
MPGQLMQAPPSDLPKGVHSSLIQWEQAMGQYNLEKQDLQKLLAMLHTMKNPMFGVMLVMNKIQDIQGAQVTAFSDVMNVETGLRDTFGTMQTEMNDATSSSASSKHMTDFLNHYNQLQTFLSYEKSLPENERVIDSSSLSSLQSSLSSIADVFNSGSTDFGNAQAMTWDLQAWGGTKGVTDPTNGDYSKHWAKLQNAFQTLNQTVSALSTTTNTQLQYLTQQFKQFLGEFQSASQSLLKYTATTVRNQRSG